ncbi:MAG: hypothetical protein FWH12_02400 [Treponema sp.]|nr:hypothetical protein [Treponema sp.]
MPKVYIEKQYNDVVRIRNNLGRDLEQMEFLIMGQLSGVVDRNTKDGEFVGLQIQPFMEIQVNEKDLAPQANAYGEGRTIFFNQTTGLFADAAGAGFVAVGQIAHNRLNPEGIVTFYKYPQAVA